MDGIDPSITYCTILQIFQRNISIKLVQPLLKMFHITRFCSTIHQHVNIFPHIGNGCIIQNTSILIGDQGQSPVILSQTHHAKDHVTVATVEYLRPLWGCGAEHCCLLILDVVDWVHVHACNYYLILDTNQWGPDYKNEEVVSLWRWQELYNNGNGAKRSCDRRAWWVETAPLLSVRDTKRFSISCGIGEFGGIAINIMSVPSTL